MCRQDLVPIKGIFNFLTNLPSFRDGRLCIKSIPVYQGQKMDELYDAIVDHTQSKLRAC